MRGCVLQPGYLPWLGFFEQFIFAEVFVFLDDVQYTKQDWRNRNRVRTGAGQGWAWLTVPVKAKGTDAKINEVKIDYTRDWIKKHLNIVRNHYQKTRHFTEVFPIIKENIERRFTCLSDLNISLVLSIAEYLNIHRKTMQSSSLDVREQDKNLRLIHICQKVGITHFYDGEKAKDFLYPALFAQHGIKVEFQIYNHPVYKQHYEPFVPYLSIIDLLFGYGKESVDVIAQTHRMNDCSDVV
jgi:hypothetical protein